MFIFSIDEKTNQKNLEIMMLLATLNNLYRPCHAIISSTRLKTSPNSQTRQPVTR